MITNSLQEFSTLLVKEKPLIGIDYGEKKLGLAISDQMHSMAMPLNIILNANSKEKIARILEYIQAHKICGIVLGLPINIKLIDRLDETSSNVIKLFAQNLSAKTDIPIYLQDERFTSKAADSLLRFYGIARKERNQIDDTVSACMILNSVLDSIRNNVSS